MSQRPTAGLPSHPSRSSDSVAPIGTRCTLTFADAATAFASGNLDAIRLFPHGRLTLLLADGEVVLLGTAEELSAKAAALEAVLDWSRTEGEPLVSIDLRSPRAPAALTASTVAAQEAAEAAAREAAEAEANGSSQNGNEEASGGDGATG